MSYGMMGDCEKFDVEQEDMDNSAQEAIERLTLSNEEEKEEKSAESEEQATAIR